MRTTVRFPQQLKYHQIFGLSVFSKIKRILDPNKNMRYHVYAHQHQNTLIFLSNHQEVEPSFPNPHSDISAGGREYQEFFYYFQGITFHGKR